ncbi:hypothetical protein AC578_1994 [Pseudocercospora eumusae]|uniref:C6 transcription factor RegA n=1 Tax=Pseudocercospora eumusae TaxID=321146 RepID=A0A139HHD7_9PEZI|nr:hypothetical protein AC578_1994 [Pseudocercospora eumusae]
MSTAAGTGSGAPEGHSGNPFVCNICRKTYGRIDHLARHFRSHTNEKPFECVECGKTFARADLLKRHATLHSSTEQSGKKRKIRASQACTACATIKVKCDQDKPCKRCRTKGLECRVDNAPSTSTYRADEQQSPPNNQWSTPLETLQSPHDVRAAPLQYIFRPVVSTPTAPMAKPSVANGPANGMSAPDDPSLTTFLSSVIHPAQATAQRTQPLAQPPPPPSNLVWNQNFNSRDLMDFSQDLSMDFNDLDAVLSMDWTPWLDPALVPTSMDWPNGRSDQVSDVSTPSIDDSINLGTAAYSRSAWRWVPNHEKGNEDHNLTTVLVESHGPDKLPRPRQIALVPPMDQQERDRIVALLLAGCDKQNYQKIVALFPSARVLDVFLNDYLLTMEHSIDSWIHIPTCRPSETIPELLTLMIAAGAILGRSSHAQKFGYALQDKARVANWELFERDNSNTRSLPALQSYATSLLIGTWSGNKRTMELAESAAFPLVTMLRRAGAFKKTRTPPKGPLPSDTPEELNHKWKAWIEAESYKRLAYHVFLHCVQVSVAFQTPPLISYAEITLDLPSPASLWRAKTAEEWRDHYNFHKLANAQLPSFVSSMCDAQTMGQVRNQIDLELTLYLVLMSHWCLAWEYTQLSSANKAQVSGDLQWAGTLLASSKCQELRRLLDSFYVAIEDWRVFVPKEVHMVSQLLRMNLCVAFEDLQLLAGKEGEGEARRVYPFLKQWYRSPECRQAMWHAGQVLRAARRPPGLSPNASRTATPDTPWLRDFNAVALYHAALAFWVYGLLSKATAMEQHTPGYQQEATSAEELEARRQGYIPAIDYEGEPIHLDGNDEELTAIERHRFIGLNKGRPVISAHSPFPRGPTSHVSPSQASPRMTAINRRPETEAELAMREVVALDDPKRVMEVMINALTPASCPPLSHARPNHLLPAGPQRPAMVENLIQLMRDLGEATSAV